MKTTRLWAALPLAVFAASAFAASPCHRPGCYGPVHGHPMKDSCEEGYYQNTIWPNQYIGPSRRGICQATQLMIENGWRRHNLLGNFHFDRETGALSEAGKLKVEWILTQSAPNRRTIFIERSIDTEKNAERQEAVQQFAADLSSGVVDVRETYVRDHGHRAASVDAVFTGFGAAQRVPALPPSASAGGSGGGAPSN
jgi:hypothetical protein